MAKLQKTQPNAAKPATMAQQDQDRKTSAWPI
jgi:hypothetical protein